MNINTICGYSKTRLRLLKNLTIIKLIMIKLKSLNGNDVIREKLDEHNTLTVEQPVVENEQTKTEFSIVLN